MRHRTGTLTAADGLELFCQSWSPDEGVEVRATVVLVHGLGEHSSRYGHVAAALVGDGYTVDTLDHRGHGHSPGRRAQVRSIDEFTGDLGLLVDRVAAEHPGVPHFMLGHSMGGLVALTYALDHASLVDALVVSGTPSAVPHTISRTTVRLGRALARVAPNAGTARLPLDHVSRDPEVVRAYFDDPLISRGRVRASMGAALINAMGRVENGAAALTLPILILHGGDDVITDADASRTLAERVGSTDSTLIIYDGLWHEIFNEPEQQRVIDDVRDFLRRQCTAARAGRTAAVS